MSKKSLNILKLLTILFGFTFTLRTQAQVTLWVTHPQVANDLNQIGKLYAKNKPSFVAKEIFDIFDTADIHQFSPTPVQLKKLLKHSPLIVGPLSHQPWLKLARKSGLLSQKATLTLDHLGGHGSTDHYWLSPKEAGNFESQVQAFFEQINLPHPSDKPWSKQIALEAKQIKSLLRNKKVTRVVLGHNALTSLFKGFNGIELTILYGEDHHQEVSVKQLKKIYQWADKPEKMLFIFEKNLSKPAPFINEGKFKNIKSIKWAPIGPSPLEHLRILLEQTL